MNHLNVAAVLATLVLACPAEATPAGHHIRANGIDLYYEVHGTGKPLILLHGGFATADSFGALVPGLEKDHQVIAVELQGHGHTADIDRPFTYQNMADDVAALIAQLKLERADVMGYSLGGGVALQLAIRHPEVVRSLVLVSSAYKREGWRPEILAGMAAMTAGALEHTPLYAAYIHSAPDPKHWPVLVKKTRDLLATPYDWTSDVRAIKAPALVVAADSDNLVPEHAVQLAELLGGATADGALFRPVPKTQLAVLPATTHYTILTRVDLVIPIVTAFLKQNY
ncbi:MAG: alpha/beta fold family hydrolase [Myxococcales bacterium]|nr:alpha/beta fold family hydrolase [Myxococcales bacterium]